MPITASVRRHPIHPMLVGIPIGLWIFSIAADLVYGLGWGGLIWKTLARYTIAAGIVGALLAAVPGFIDFTSISVRRVKMVAMTHMVANLTVVILFAASLWLRVNDPIGRAPVAISALGILLLALAGWLGGELVFVHRMGVSDQRPGASTRSGRRAA